MTLSSRSWCARVATLAGSIAALGIAPGCSSTESRQSAEAGIRACNGHSELCSRTFDSVAFPGTHNSNAAREYGYTVNANQIDGLSRQLDDGIRAMLIDVYTDGDAGTVFCHGFCSIAKTSHLEGLRLINDFLDAHPNEVMTFIYEDHADPAVIVADLEASGLAARAFAHSPGAPWPTLGEMIDAGTRLVVTAETAGPPPSWFHHVWDEAFDTPYSFYTQADFSCSLNRGAATNDLFLLNHWLYTTGVVELPTEDGAKEVNVAAVLGARATQCRQETGHVPNFVAVDFYQHGDLFAVVDALNGI